MTALVPATLQRLTRVGKPAPNQPARVKPDGDALPVQFNPATVKISRRNNVDRAGATIGSQKVQHPSTEPSTLTFELEFDTAEQGTSTARVNVRRWTALLRQFVEPPDDKPEEAAPAVQFAWGTLIYRGIVTDLSEDLDHFAPDGTPLHAKVNITISEQRFELEATAGAARRDAGGALAQGGISASASLGLGAGASLGISGGFGASFGASASLGAGAALGMSGTADPTSLVAALDGESAQQLLARLDKDPAGWRAAMNGLDSPLALSAGGTVQIGAEVDVGVGLDVRSGFASADGRADGFALSAAGGIAAATAQVEVSGANVATAQARASFDVPAGVSSASVDVRASTYGHGVPLQVITTIPGFTTGSGDAAADAAQRARDTGSSTLRWSPGS